MKDLLINGNGIKAKKLIELENALVDSQRRITSLETINETLRERMVKLEHRLIENNLSINKQIANMQEDQRNQAFEILELQTKNGIKPKPLKKVE
jgi:predicted  nucleic acid-binding Zn-ribbon protein